MLTLGLTIAERADYHRMCMGHHRRVILMYLTNNNETILANISDQFVDGQIDVDYTADISRKLTTTVFDPDYRLGLDSPNIVNGAMFADRMLYVIYQVWAPDGSHGYGCPVFMGPISKVNRTGNFLSLEGSGKEYFMFGSSWWKRTYQKGHYRNDIMAKIVLDSGEAYNKFYIPASTTRLAKDLSISFDQATWPVLKEQAAAEGRIVTYNGAGELLVRNASNANKFTFTKFCSEPEISFDLENVINSVIVIGGKPKGKKSQLARRFVAPSSSPLNPYAIGRTGFDGNTKPRYFTRVIEDNGLTNMTKIIQVGNQALKDGLLQSVDASFTAPVLPDLEEMDVYTMVHEGVANTSRMLKMSFPLTGAPIATYGYLRKINPNKAAIRRHK